MSMDERNCLSRRRVLPVALLAIPGPASSDDAASRTPASAMRRGVGRR